MRPPRDNLFRSIAPGPELRDSGTGDPTLTGHFAVFNEWTEINSWIEGRFLERVAPGAYRKTFRENRDSMKVLLNHGHDTLGMQTLGSIDVLREDAVGAYYEVPLNRGIPELVMDGLRKKQYGASFRFDVLREERVEKPKVSAYNPQALPERTITEARVFEFGPVTFPAYASATAGVRSLTDEILFRLLAAHPAFQRSLDPNLTSQLTQLDAFIDQADELIDTILDANGIADPDEVDEPEENAAAARLKGITRKLALIKAKAPSKPGAAVTAPRAGAPLVVVAARKFKNREEFLSWISLT